MQDGFNRRIHYLRVSVTDRCNLRCRYCMPFEGVPMLRHEDVLTFEEIRDLVQVAVRDFHFDKVRLTGGEPLVRRGIVDLVRMIAEVPGIRDYAMTTNGIHLEKFAPLLKRAGLMRINVSLDAVDPERYREITRGGDVALVLRGIRAAIDAGLTPLKLNCVVRKDSLEPDARAVADFGASLGVQVRYIHQMSMPEGTFSVVKGGSGGDCGSCNRMRLSSDGYLYPCLFNDLKYSVRQLGAVEALSRAIGCKPASGESSHHNAFYRIGG